MSQLVDPTPLATRSLAELAAPLRRLRRRMARWFWLDGLHRLAWTLLALAVVDFGLDRWFRFDRPQRAIMLVLALGVAGAIVARRLVRPLFASPSDDALCLEVERHQRDLGQRLISALQLARASDWAVRGISPELAEATIRQGVTAAAHADWNGVLDASRERRNLWGLAAAVVIAGTFAGWSFVSPLPGIWWRRNVQLIDEAWPQKTYLEFAGLVAGQLRVARGDSLNVQVIVSPSSAVVPSRVLLEFRPARGRAAIAMHASRDSLFEHQLARVIEPVELRAIGGDAVTPWIPVELLEPPGLQSIRIEVLPPAYTRLARSELPGGIGPHVIVEGSELNLFGVATKPLRAAQLVHEKFTREGELGADGKVAWSLAPSEVLSGRYSLYVVDQQGIRPREPVSFTLQVRPDQPPKVDAKLVGVGGLALPNARLPLALHLRDDFAVTDARVAWQARGEAEGQTTNTNRAALPEFAPFANRADVSFNDTLELAPLGLVPGQTLTFHVEATDNDPTDGPNLGKSSEFLVRIVAAEELRSDWLRREKEQRQELEQALKNEEALATDTQALAAEESLSETDRAALSALARRQKQIAQQVAGIASRLEQLAAEVVNNRLDQEPDRLADRLQNELARPLRKIADESAGAAQQSLEEARRVADSTAERRRALEASGAAEEQAVNELRTVLERMKKAEGFQEAVQLLYEIQRAQQEVHDRTQREKQQRIEAILRGGSKPKP